MRPTMLAAFGLLFLVAQLSGPAQAGSSSLGISVTISGTDDARLLRAQTSKECEAVTARLSDVAPDWSGWRIGECSAKSAPLIAADDDAELIARP